MQIELTRNQRHGRGYQLTIAGHTWDEESYPLSEAVQLANIALEEINRAEGTAYKLHEVLRIDSDAMAEDAKAGDIVAAQLQKNSFKKEIDGVEYLNDVGMIRLMWEAAQNDKESKGKAALLEFCRVCASRGVGGGATKLHGEIMGIKYEEQALAWIRDKLKRGRITGDDLMGIMERLA